MRGLAMEGFTATAISISSSNNVVAGNYVGTTAPQLFDGQRHRVAVTWENRGGMLMFHVDGEQLGLGRNSYQKTTTIDAGGTVVIGQHQGAPGSSFDVDDTFAGTIYDVRVFDHVRTGQQIAASFRSDLPYDEPGMLANWWFNDLSSDGAITETVQETT